MEKLILKRTEITEKYAKGELWYKDKMICYTLEDPPRDIKIMHETGIPEGTYQIIINYSPRFKRKLPLLLNVPNFEGIRIHKGNFTRSTSGCVLVGTIFNRDVLLHSTSAFTIVFNLLTNLLKKNQVFIEIKNPEKPIIIQANHYQYKFLKIVITFILC